MSNILQELETQIADLKTAVTKSNVGTVRQIGDGVAKVEGLSDVMLNEMIEFPGGLYGLALNLEETEVGCILLGEGLDIKEGDEVITPTYSFYATAGAIATTGAKPVYVDIKKDLNIDEEKIEKKITNRTKAIVPVHWSGRICNMRKIVQLAKKYKLHIVEDACHAILAHDDKKKFAGNFGITGCFSMHPLKNLNVWGDGGVITTNNKKIYEKLKLMRNHGLINRNNWK